MERLCNEAKIKVMLASANVFAQDANTMNKTF